MVPLFHSLMLLSWSLVLAVAHAATTLNLTFADLQRCPLNTLELRGLTDAENVEPCLLYDINPAKEDFDTVVTLVQVTSTACHQHRDGQPVAVEKLNALHDGRGFAIGFHHNHHVGFRLVSAVAGNQNYLGRAAYGALHEHVLRTLLEATQGEFRYIVGTCSGDSTFEREAARDYETVLMAQVGPPSYYTTHNPWVFGFHINSDEYTRDSIQQLKFYAEQRGILAQLPVRVIYRTSSEFFYSTCKAAIGYLETSGFQDVVEVLYDQSADDDGDGVDNIHDEDFLFSIADEICPPGSAEDPLFRPAIYMCVSKEQNVLLDRFRSNGCLFSSLWMTPTGWTWGFENADLVPHFQGAGQWHAAFTYGDQFFASGREMLEYNSHRVGYLGGYDMLVGYAIPTLFAEHLRNTYRIFDNPDPMKDHADPVGRERLRRLLLNIRGQTIFGPVIFDDNQRNIGRGAAHFQWQPRDPHSLENLELSLVSPLSQAESPLVLPSPSVEICDAGNFVNLSLAMDQDALLLNKCSFCPMGTYANVPNADLQCKVCQPGSNSSDDRTSCIIYEDNLLSTGTISFGYTVMAATWCLALAFLVWVLRYRKDPVVKIAQPPYLMGICIGAIVTSSAILAFSQQAGMGEDDALANHGCVALPFLYSVGWVIQYGCVCAKSMRLQQIVGKPRWHRVTLNKTNGLSAVLAPAVFNIIILVIWTVVLPLEYQRHEIGRDIDDGILVIETVGRCRPSTTDGSMSKIAWLFIACIMLVHASLMLSTHWLLFKVRSVNDRYQEQKFLGIAAVFALEILVIGIPILIAARDSVEATYFVICGIISLDSIGLLCFTFLPKIRFVREGLSAGVGLGESILTETHQRAVMREAMKREGFSSNSNFSAFSSEPAIPEGNEYSGGVNSNYSAYSSDPVIPTGNEYSGDLRKDLKPDVGIEGGLPASSSPMEEVVFTTEEKHQPPRKDKQNRRVETLASYDETARESSSSMFGISIAHSSQLQDDPHLNNRDQGVVDEEAPPISKKNEQEIFHKRVEGLTTCDLAGDDGTSVLPELLSMACEVQSADDSFQKVLLNGRKQDQERPSTSSSHSSRDNEMANKDQDKNGNEQTVNTLTDCND